MVGICLLASTKLRMEKIHFKIDQIKDSAEELEILTHKLQIIKANVS